MSIFYHVSTNLFHDGVFIPRVPEHRHKQAEDDQIGRVSVSPSIELCLTAIPGGGMNLEELNIEQRGYYLIFKIDTKKLEIKSSDIVTDQTLYQSDMVRDAGMTEEHWITTSFTVPEEDRFIIKLNEWEETPEDILPYHIFEIGDRRFDGDYISAYMDIYDDFVPSSVRIQNLNYITGNLKKDEEFSLYFDTDRERDYLLSYLHNNPLFSVLDVSIDQIECKMDQDGSVEGLFLHHAKWLSW